MIVKYEVYVVLHPEDESPEGVDDIAGKLLDVLIASGYGHDHEISDPTADDEIVQSVIAIRVVDPDDDWLENAVKESAAIGFPVNT